MYQLKVLVFCIFYLFSTSIYADTQCRVVDKVLNPAIYTGKCSNGLANGYGTAMHKTLAITYKGQFKNGRFNGSGKFIIEKKDKTKKTWEGRWRNGELNGYGKFTSSTYFYKGQWINGKKNGKGTSKNIPSGPTFTGQFKNGKRLKGRLTFSDGTYVQSQWVNGKVNGFTVETMKNGSIYKGQYKNNQRHGKGQITFSDGTATSGVWKNGKAVSGNVMKLLRKSIRKPQRPRYIAPIATSGVIESKIDGEFQGWEGETIFKLMNGQIWQQSQYSYTYHYAYMPNVIIYPSNGLYKMKVDGVDSTIYVQRLR